MRQVIIVIVFLVVLFFGLSVYYLIKDRQALKKKKLVRELAKETAGGDLDEKLIWDEKTRSALENLLGRVMDIAVMESLLISADIPLSLERFLTLSLGLGLLFLLPVLFFFHNPLVLIFFLAIGLSLPFLYLIYRKKRREEALVRQLPDALDMIVRALKVGQSVDNGLREVGRGFPPPIGSEIRTVYEEMAVGLPFETALRNFEARFPNVADVKILCAAFIVQRETGGNLTMILEGLARAVRERFQLKRQVKALTAEGRITSLVLGVLPMAFAGITWILNPDYITILFSDPLGRRLLALAIALEIAGFTIMRLVSKIEV